MTASKPIPITVELVCCWFGQQTDADLKTLQNYISMTLSLRKCVKAVTGKEAQPLGPMIVEVSRR